MESTLPTIATLCVENSVAPPCLEIVSMTSGSVSNKPQLQSSFVFPSVQTVVFMICALLGASGSCLAEMQKIPCSNIPHGSVLRKGWR
ncbi:hypothetical protein J6590_089229 [Homalodisca vitripennis]|nr:hypothetical protein J6590_089229 [Homalodisca vitripennis]